MKLVKTLDFILKKVVCCFMFFRQFGKKSNGIMFIVVQCPCKGKPLKKILK